MTPALLRLIAALVCLHACMAGMRMAAPLLALSQGRTAASVGVLMALFALSQVFLSIPAGRFADRHGLRRPVGWAVVVACSGVGLAVWWPTFWVLCLAALCTGAATGGAMIALQRQAGQLATGPKALKQVFSWLAIGPALANFVGPFSAGVLIDVAGFRWAFAVMALLPLVTWWLVRRQPPLVHSAAVPAAVPGSAWDLMRERPFRRLMIVNWLLSSSWDVHTFLVPVLGHDLGMSASAIGGILGAFALAAVAIRVVMPMVADHLREEMVVACAMAAAAVLLALYPFAQQPLFMGVLSVLLGMALGSVQPMVMSMLHQITPAQRHGEALGFRMMAINASSVVMPLMFGSVGVAVGASGVFWGVALMVGSAARWALSIRQPSA